MRLSRLFIGIILFISWEVKAQGLQVDIGIIIDTLTTPCNGPVELDAHHEGYLFLWNTGETTQKIIVRKQGTYYVSVTSPDNPALKGSDTATVTFAGNFSVNLGKDTTFCGECISLDAGDYGPGTQYAWKAKSTSAEGKIFKYCSSDSVPVQVSVKVTNSIGCTAYDTIMVTSKGNYQLDLGPDIYSCKQNDAVTISDTKNPGRKHLWNTGDTTTTITVNKSGKYYVKLFGLPACASNDTIVDTVNVFIGSPLVSLGSDTTLCGNCLMLNAGAQPAGVTYLWSTGEKTSGIQYCGSGASTVSVTVSNPGKCTATSSININFNRQYNLNLGSDIVYCGQNVTLSDNQFASYRHLWNTGDTSSSIVAKSSGVYYLKVFGLPSACSPLDTLTDSVKVNLISKIPAPSAINDNSVPCSGAHTYSISPVSGSQTYSWQVPPGWNITSGQGTTAITVTPAAGDTSGTIYVKADNGNTACQSDSASLSVKILDYDLAIYNVFSPNGDGINDVWKIKNIDYYPDNELVILNRWGNEVYKASGYNSSKYWDGGSLSEGVYFYQLKVTICNVSRTFTGDVTIVK